MIPRKPLVRVEQFLRRSGRRILVACPWARVAIEFCWSLYVCAYVKGVALVHLLVRPAGSPIDPHKVVSVDPDRVRRRTFDFRKSKFKYAGAVLSTVGEDLDRSFEDLTSYRGLVEHFEEGVPWEETELYRDVVARIERGEELWGCSTLQEFHERCERLDELYEVIDEEGYRSQRELAAGEGTEPISKRRFFLTRRIVEDEINVCIGPDGEFLFADGRNRLTIAKILDLDEVPVCILARHEEWQRKRTRLARDELDPASLPPAQRDHPDLREFVDESARRPLVVERST